MVLRHFHLREQPFGVTPDPRFLLSTETHREALAAVLYGIESGLGFIALTANPGMGKTTLVFEALSRLRESARTVFLFGAITSPLELIRALLIDLGEEDPQGSIVDLENRLNEVLMAQSETGKRLVVVLDEAQNLDESVLEAVRMLSNFETASHKLLQIVLCGQLQLADRLSEPRLLQLRQRISIFAHIQPLSLFETADYIQHRLKVAGYQGERPLFNSQAVSLIAHHSGGIPRNINNLCFNALSLACALRKNVIDAEVVSEVVGDLHMHRDTAEGHIAITELDRPEHRPGMRARFKRSWPALRVAGIAMVLSAIVSAAGWTYLVSAGVLGDRKAVHSAPPAVAPKPANLDNDAASKDPDSPTDPLPAAAPQPVKLDKNAASQDVASAVPSSPATASDSGDEPRAQVEPAAPPVSRAHSKSSRHRHREAVPAKPPESSPSLENELRLVEARRGQSVAGICVEQFGGCTPALLNKIIDLNPRITDPDHIQQGTRVILPAAVTTPNGRQRIPTGG